MKTPKINQKVAEDLINNLGGVLKTWNTKKTKWEKSKD